MHLSMFMFTICERYGKYLFLLFKALFIIIINVF